MQSRTNQSPNNSLNHSISRSDGHCVPRAGKESARVDDSIIQEIPLKIDICNVLSQIKPQARLLVVSVCTLPFYVSVLRPCSPICTKKTLISQMELKGPLELTTSNLESAWFTVKATTVSDRLRAPDFRSCSLATSLENAFAVVRLLQIQEYHL